MDEDSRTGRLREYIQLYLRRKQRVNEYEQRRILFLSEERFIKSSESKANSRKAYSKRKVAKNKLYYDRNKKRTKITTEEIGRSHHTIRQEPHQYDEIFTDVAIDSYAVANGHYASVRTRDGDQKFSKLFVTPEEADFWIRNTAMKLSKVITQ